MNKERKTIYALIGPSILGKMEASIKRKKVYTILSSPRSQNVETFQLLSYYLTHLNPNPTKLEKNARHLNKARQEDMNINEN
ncbi:MAG: hypothetical protein ABSD92_03185 [Candidatus Bathyarchaeia archaeon]